MSRYNKILKILDCLPFCLKCNNKFDCTNCDDSHYLKDGTCLTDCPAGYEKVDRKCIKCPESCTNCKASTTDNTKLDICTNCDTGNYLFKSKCVKDCPITTYKTNTTCECI